MNRKATLVALSVAVLFLTAPAGFISAQAGRGTVPTAHGEVSGVFENGVTY